MCKVKITSIWFPFPLFAAEQLSLRSSLLLCPLFTQTSPVITISVLSQCHFFPSYRSVWIWCLARGFQNRLWMSCCCNHSLHFCAPLPKRAKTEARMYNSAAHRPHAGFSLVVVVFCLWIIQHMRLHSATAQIVLPALMTSLRQKSMVLYLCREPTPFSRDTYGSTCVRGGGWGIM